MIFAAGLGTRLRPLTDSVPKALIDVGGQPLLGRLLDKLEAEGAGRVVVNVHHLAQQVVDYLAQQKHRGLDIRVSDESQQLLDTGGGLRKAAPLFDTDRPILIHNVDILSNAHLGQLYMQAASCDAALLVSERTTTRYLLFSDDMRLVGWANTLTGEVRTPHAHLDPSRCHRLAFAGIHVFAPRLFGMMRPWPGKFSITDFYISACAKANIRGVLQPGLQLLDVGKADTLAKAEAFASML